ncbi:hypothetical protein ACFOYW_17845 [Gryllotalpicola reticulitermitis]|uniref:DUF4350 domain-containing protein n=1 Tax=Gryllotalpicola reticulitermitis TaxID=1184153 RepID=A0ABV8QA60_9MICO
MTATSAGRAPAAAEVLSPSLGQRARAGRGWLVGAAVIFVAAILALLLVGQSTQQSPPLDPSSSTPSGAKALLNVLRAHGVEVRSASTLGAAERATAGASPDDVTVAIYDPSGYLSLKRIAHDAKLPGRIVLIAPVPGVEQPLLEAGRDVRIVSAATALENGSILHGDNAGNAVRLFGARSRLVWYTPTIADSSAGTPATIADLTPGWVTPLVVLGGLTAVVAAVWRGRRFGPLVVEDLPVAVRASEALDGRARLYQRSDARLHALDALRMGAVGRLAKRLGLGPGAPVLTVCAAVAAQTGIDPREVRAVLLEASPRNDRDLLDLAQRVRAIEGAADPRPVPTSTAPAPQPDTARTAPDPEGNQGHRR